MFEEYQVVRLKGNLPKHNMAPGTKGTIVFVYEDKPDMPKAYEVEFVDNQGKTLAQLTVFENELEEDTEVRK